MGKKRCQNSQKHVREEKSATISFLAYRESSGGPAYFEEHGREYCPSEAGIHNLGASDQMFLHNDRVHQQIRSVQRHFTEGSTVGEPKVLQADEMCLRILQDTAVKREWEDLETLLKEDEADFIEALSPYPAFFKKRGRLLFDKIRRYLFTETDLIHWNATLWYLERFALPPERINPVHPVIRLSFMNLHDGKNRSFLQRYMKYMICVTDRSVLTIQNSCRWLQIFLRFLEREGRTIEDTDAYLFERFLHEDDCSKAWSAATVNTVLREVRAFYRFLSDEGLCRWPVFDPDRYRQREYRLLRDRCVPEELQIRFLNSLKDLPLSYRLVCLHLHALGLRISEVCMLCVGDYYRKDEDFWLRVSGSRGIREIPIPETLYVLMERYIKNRNLPKDAFVFGRKDEPMHYSAFMRRMKKWQAALGADLAETPFCTNDFRYSTAARLHAYGCSISVIRDYLGHSESETTERCIGGVPDEIRTKSEAYFEKHTLWEERDA